MRSFIKREEDAFTIIELIVVVAIIGIVGSIAVGSFINQRKNTQDAHTTDTLAAISLSADTWIVKSSDPRTLDLSVLNTGGIEGIKSGTVVGIQGTETGYCATAWHSDGTFTETEPLLFDSIKDGFIYDEDDFVALGACSPTQLGNPIEPAYKVEEGQLERITPADAPLPSVCHGVVPYDYYHELTAVDINGERQDLDGTVSLSDDCRELNYELRVINADKNATYTLPLTFSNMTEGGSLSQSGYAYNVIIEGTESITASIPTNWEASNTWKGIILNDSWQTRYSDIVWQVPEPTL